MLHAGRLTPLIDDKSAPAQHISNAHSTYAFCTQYTPQHSLHTFSFFSTFRIIRSPFPLLFHPAPPTPFFSFPFQRLHACIPQNASFHSQQTHSPSHPDRLLPDTPLLTQLSPCTGLCPARARGRASTSSNSPAASCFRQNTQPSRFHAPTLSLPASPTLFLLEASVSTWALQLLSTTLSPSNVRESFRQAARSEEPAQN